MSESVMRRLIKEARACPQPTELFIDQDDVTPLALEFIDRRMVQLNRDPKWLYDANMAEYKRGILRGGMRFMGVPVRVRAVAEEIDGL